MPSGAPISSSSRGILSSPPDSVPGRLAARTPVRLSRVLVIISTWETAAIEDRASPRKPSVVRLCRSLSVRILLVAWRVKAAGICSAGMPDPLSVTRIREMPPSRISILMAVAPASMAFSISSLATLRGLSTTSPAAILLMVSSLNT